MWGGRGPCCCCCCDVESNDEPTLSYADCSARITGVWPHCLKRFSNFLDVQTREHRDGPDAFVRTRILLLIYLCGFVYMYIYICVYNWTNSTPQITRRTCTGTTCCNVIIKRWLISLTKREITSSTALLKFVAAIRCRDKKTGTTKTCFSNNPICVSWFTMIGEKFGERLNIIKVHPRKTWTDNWNNNLNKRGQNSIFSGNSRVW